VQESPERGTKRGKGQGEERGGLIWKTRHQELAEKMEKLEAEHEKTRLAAEAALARRTILEQEMKLLRNRIRELLEKSATDDVLIGALAAERAAPTARCVPTSCAQQLANSQQEATSLQDHTAPRI
jgi:hypothetical protein